MAKILLIETSTEVCGAAIAVDGQIVALREEQDAPSHAAILTQQIADCVAESGIALQSLDAVAVSAGPGSYTTLRVGTAVAKGICFALSKPLLAVDTLMALALASKKEIEKNNINILFDKLLFVPMIDARRMEVCTAIYDNNLNVILASNPKILTNNLFDDILKTNEFSQNNICAVFSGNGCFKIDNVFLFENTVFSSIKKCSVEHLATPAETLLQSADIQDLTYYSPVYIKIPNITTARNTYF